MNKDQLLKKMWNSGYFWDPRYPNTFNVDPSSLMKLDLEHKIVGEAILSWQMSDANYSILSAMHHARRGAIGVPAGPTAELDDPTWSLVNLDRCPMPDYPPPEGFNVISDDPGYKHAVETMREFSATGSGSWPAPGCDPDLPQSHKQFHSIIVSIDITSAPAKFKDPAYKDKAIQACVDCYAEIGLLVRYDLEKKVSKPQIAKRFQALPGSVIGWNEFPPSGTCNATINGRLDTGYVPNDYRLWANLEVHETGHGVGLSHTRGHIMNPSILLVWPLSWKGGPSESTLRRYFGGEPVPPINVIDWTDFLTV